MDKLTRSIRGLDNTVKKSEVKEDSKQGFDIMVSIKLKQYRDFGTKVCTVSENTVSVQNARPAESSPEPSTNQTYTVQTSDTLWSIARKFYGDESKRIEIYKANMGRKEDGKIENPNRIYPGQVLTIPALK
jgi:nucleoid-associated protein YgaU